MKNIYELVTLELQNEHDLEHDLEYKSPFTTPKIYDANGDLSKRWYVYFSYQDPDTGRLKRMKNIYGIVNKYKTKEARYSILRIYKKRLYHLLKEGYNPLVDNTAFHQNKINDAKSQEPGNGQKKRILAKATEDTYSNLAQSPKADQPDSSVQGKRIEEGILYGLKLKQNLVADKTMADYKNRCDGFLKWLKEQHPKVKSMGQIDKKITTEFLNHIQLTTSPRNRNNYRTCLSSIFQVLEDNEIITKNVFKAIKPLKTKPQRHRRYSDDQQHDIFEYLEREDPVLLLFIKFISYNFLRPLEACRLLVRDIDLKSKTVSFKAKNKEYKTKLIPDIMIAELPDLSKMDGDSLLFTPDGFGGLWDATENNRRDYFSKRFKKVVKDHFGLDKNYGLYSFRHTYIARLFRSLEQDRPTFEAKSILMQITGHSTMEALEKYLRDIDAELPKDYSKHLE